MFGVTTLMVGLELSSRNVYTRTDLVRLGVVVLDEHGGSWGGEDSAQRVDLVLLCLALLIEHLVELVGFLVHTHGNPLGLDMRGLGVTDSSCHNLQVGV